MSGDLTAPMGRGRVVEANMHPKPVWSAHENSPRHLSLANRVIVTPLTPLDHECRSEVYCRIGRGLGLFSLIIKHKMKQSRLRPNELMVLQRQ